MCEHALSPMPRRIQMKALFVFLFSVPLFLCYRPLFKDANGALDKSARFSAIYRQDSNKLSNEDMFKLLADFKKFVHLSTFWLLYSC